MLKLLVSIVSLREIRDLDCRRGNDETLYICQSSESDHEEDTK